MHVTAGWSGRIVLPFLSCLLSVVLMLSNLLAEEQCAPQIVLSIELEGSICSTDRNGTSIGNIHADDTLFAPTENGGLVEGHLSGGQVELNTPT
jgi:hypothetical protein